MNSSLLLALCIALSVFSGATGAPTRAAADVDFNTCKDLSITLNEIARDLYNKVESSDMRVIIVDPPVSIRQIDSCDPWSLETNKETCQSRIILALKNYTEIFHNDGVFKNPACSNWREQASEVGDITRDLLKVLKQPVVDDPVIPVTVDMGTIALCRDSVERLYSFSIMSARVFSFLASPAAPKVEDKQC